MSCNYAEGLSEYENKGRLGAPEKFDTVEEVTEKVDQLVQLVKQAKHIGRAPVQTPEICSAQKQRCGSGMFIPDPNFFHPGSSSKNFKYFNPKKWFLSSRKYDSGCSSQIRIPDPDPDYLPIPDLGSKCQKGTGSRILSTRSEV
jgi:hypothetical protein